MLLTCLNSKRVSTHILYTKNGYLWTHNSLFSSFRMFAFEGRMNKITIISGDIYLKVKEIKIDQYILKDWTNKKGATRIYPNIL